MSATCYNYKTGNILIYERYIVRWEQDGQNLRFWYKKNKCKNYLVPIELEDLEKTIRWLLTCGCDFGPDVNRFGEGSETP